MQPRPAVAVFDFDGTLTDVPWPYWSGPDAVPNPAVAELVARLAVAGVRVVVLSGRPEAHRRDVERWLATHGVGVHEVILRPPTTPDNGPQDVAAYKRAHVAGRIEREHVLLFADDEPAARAAVASLGVPVLDPTGTP